MATNYAAAPNDSRPTGSSPRQKGRENAKNVPCRNQAIYGYCRYEKDGCMYNHDATNPGSSQTQAENQKNRFNVESPAFTPNFSSRNGTSSKAISPKAANAAAFTPRGTKANLATPPAMLRDHSSEWSNQDIPEFVPQNFNPNVMGPDSSSSPGMADAYNPYADSSFASLDATPGSQALNPYAPDSSAPANQAFYQQAPAFTQPLQHHLYAPIGPHRENLLAYQRTAHDFFISETLRQDLQRKADATLQVLHNSNLPGTIEHFHSLVPLDTNNQRNTTAFGYNSWVYKASSSKDGYTYALRRLEGFRLTNEKAVRSVQAWKRINNGSVVTVHDCFTTRAFGDSSLVVVTDYHPLSKSLAEHHFPSPSTNFQKSRGAGAVLPEQVLWGYIVQIASALKAIHTNGLAARLIIPSKVLLTSKNRIRINGCAVLDVVQSTDATPLAQMQQEDLRQLGRLILTLASNGASGGNASSGQKPMDILARNYSQRFRDCVMSLIDQPRDVDSFIASISDQTLTILDNVLHLEDEMCSDLSRELENGRLVRLMTKLNFINERPEYTDYQHGQNQWGETGERYHLKLFRDFVFHQVNQDGKPIVDLGHVISCLNKLDAGTDEKITLVGRDEQNVFVVNYREVKRSLETAFQELVRPPRRM